MAIAKIIPVYQYHAATPVWRYFYTSDPDIQQGWSRDGIAFYAFTDSSDEAVELFRYYAADRNPWRYLYSTRNDLDSAGIAPGWAIDGGMGIGNDQRFYAFPSDNPGTNSRPVYQFVARNPWRYGYALSDTPPGPGWTLDTDPNLVNANGIAFYVFDADVPDPIPGFDYTLLTHLLQSERWKEADEETGRIMLESVGRSFEDSFQPGELERIPCSVLSRLDALWMGASQGRFGFSVQRTIWSDALAVAGGDVEAAGTGFGQSIGQFNNTGQLIFYNDLTFDLSAPIGHLPVLWWRRSMVLSGFGRPVESIVSRMNTCGI